MSDHVKQTIADLQAELAEQEQVVLDQKRLINSLCKRAKIPPIYGDAELILSGGPTLAIQSDQFYGRPLAACIREILELRRTSKQGPVTINELYDALNDGGFKFETKNEENSKRGLRQSLTKNNATFHKLPNGKFGLLEWYPSAKATKPKNGNDTSDGNNGAEAPAEEEEPT
jgi:hypothetical protein